MFVRDQKFVKLVEKLAYNFAILLFFMEKEQIYLQFFSNNKNEKSIKIGRVLLRLNYL